MIRGSLLTVCLDEGVFSDGINKKKFEIVTVPMPWSVE